MKSFYSISAVAIIAALFFVGTTPTNINFDKRLDYILFNYMNSDPGDAYSIHQFPANSGENLEVRTSGGSINASLSADLGLDLDLKGSNVVVQLQNFTGETKRNIVSGSMNGGRHNVSMRTSGGTVR